MIMQSLIGAASSGGAINFVVIDPGGSLWRAVCGNDLGTTLYAYDQYTQLKKSTDSGGSFSVLATSPAGLSSCSLACSKNGQSVYLLSGTSLYRSSNAGATWTTTTLSYPCNEVQCSDDGSRLILRSSGTTDTSPMCAVSINSGVSFTYLLDTSSHGGGRGIAISGDGTYMLAKAYSGTANTYICRGVVANLSFNQTITQNSPPRGMAYSGTGRAVACNLKVHSGSAPKLSQDGGVTWNTLTSPANTCENIAISSDGNTLITHEYTSVGGTSGYVYTSSDFGVSWTKQTSIPAVSLITQFYLSSDGAKKAVVTNGFLYVS